MGLRDAPAGRFEIIANRAIAFLQLAHAALEYARDAKLRVVPTCPFVRAYLDRHPEYHELLDSSAGPVGAEDSSPYPYR